MKNKLISILRVISIMLIIICTVLLIIDYVCYYRFGSAPFYVYILVRGIEFILPAILCLIIAYCLKGKK